MNGLLSAADVAARAKVSVKTVYRWVDRGLLAYVGLPGNDLRFERATVEALLEERVRRPPGRHRAGAQVKARRERTEALLRKAGQKG